MLSFFYKEFQRCKYCDFTKIVIINRKNSVSCVKILGRITNIVLYFYLNETSTICKLLNALGKDSKRPKAKDSESIGALGRQRI